MAVHFCRLLPPFNLGEGLISLAAFHLLTQLQVTGTVLLEESLLQPLNLTHDEGLCYLPSLPANRLVGILGLGVCLAACPRMCMQATPLPTKAEAHLLAPPACSRRACLQDDLAPAGTAVASVTSAGPGSSPTSPAGGFGNATTRGSIVQDKDSLIPSDALPAGYSQSSPFDWSVTGRNLAALYGGAVMHFILLLAFDAYYSRYGEPHISYMHCSGVAV